MESGRGTSVLEQVGGSGGGRRCGGIRLRRRAYLNRHSRAVSSHGGQRDARGGGSNKIATTSSSLCVTMSLSPTTSNEYEPSSAKRRRTSFTASSQRSEMAQSPQEANGSGQGLPPPVAPAHIPKRGARACTACRKGKNRCEGEVRLDHLLHCRILTARLWPALSARPGRVGPLSTLPIERYSLCLRKAREEKCAGLVWC